MKKLTISVITVIVFISAVVSGYLLLRHGKSPDTDKNPTVTEYKVSSFNGLVLRSEPSVNAKKITLIDYAEPVKVSGYSDTEITVDGITAKWAHVTYGDKTGWAFSGYLKEELPFDSAKLTAFCDNPFPGKTMHFNTAEKTQDSIVAALGNPEKIEDAKTANRHMKDVVDTIRTITYPGVIFTLYIKSTDGMELSVGFRITGNSLTPDHDITIGGPFKKAFDAFGYPVSVKDGIFIYNLDESSPDTLEFAVDRNMNIKNIAYHAYID